MGNDPTSLDEYNARYNANTRIEGFGLEVKTHSPCIFCGAPDWQIWPIADPHSAMRVDTKCEECGRSGKAIIQRTDNMTIAEWVQTGGPDMPAWYPLTFRRVPS